MSKSCSSLWPFYGSRIPWSLSSRPGEWRGFSERSGGRGEILFLWLKFEFLFLPLPPKVDGGDVFTPVCFFVTRISQKFIDRFWQNLVDRLGVWQGRIESILVKIGVRICEIFNFYFWVFFFFFTLYRVPLLLKEFLGKVYTGRFSLAFPALFVLALSF